MSIIGVEKMHYSKLLTDTEAGATYEAPKFMSPSIKVSVKTDVSTETQYGDNKPQETASAVGATEVEIEVTDLPTAVVADLLGINRNADGVLEFSSDYTAPYVAIMFEGTKSNGEKRLVCLTKGQFSIPENAFETKSDGVSFQSQTITGTFIARVYDGKFKFQVDSDDESIGETVVTNWYTEVYGSTPAA